MRLRIRPTLLSATVCLVTVTTAGLAAAINTISGRIVEDLVDRRFQTIAESASAQVAELVGMATSVLYEQRALAAQGLLPIDDSMALGRRLAERLREQPRLAWISYGDLEQDRFVGATRLAEGGILVNRSEAAVNGGRPVEALALANGRWRYVDNERPSYSVVAQPWFKSALGSDGIAFTGPYTFAEGLTGLTLSLRWTDEQGSPRGVFTVDFFLDDLSRRLATLTGDRGDAVLLDLDGQVLASAGLIRPPAHSDAASTALVDHRKAMLTAVPGSSTNVTVVAPSGEFQASLSRIEGGLGVEWVLVVLESRATLFAPLRRLHWVIWAVSALIALPALAAAILLARRLAQPLDVLSSEADRIRRFDLEGSMQVRSNIVELATLIDSIGSMKAGLRSFGRYVPRDVVERLIATGGAATLGGERRELTLLFSDIAGFTSLSESIPPEQVMQYTSHYLDAMSRAIHLNSGVIDKFIGDAIMAIWNAPERDPDHASHACQALLDCMLANTTLDREAADSGLPILATRFGLHTGEVVVGNVGSAERMQYTALGANVNLASRLEALNKHYGTSNLVSGEVRARAARHFVFRSVALVMPTGTTKPVEVFELLGTMNDRDATPVSDWVGRWEGAMSALRNGDPDTASTLFEALAGDRPADKLALFYVAKSAELRRRENLPWDGIDHFGEK